MRIRFALIVIAASGCARSETTDESRRPAASAPEARSFAEAVKADLSTPDRALKSYWRFKDATNRYDEDLVRAHRETRRFKEYLDQERTLLGGDALSYAEYLRRSPYTRQSQSYEIIEVKQETESRATIIAKIRNTTPLDSGTVVDESDQKRRRDGSTVRYVVERDSTGWRVVQAYTRLFEDQGEWRAQWQPNERYVPTHVSP